MKVCGPVGRAGKMECLWIIYELSILCDTILINV